jgi:hypothetical protein
MIYFMKKDKKVPGKSKKAGQENSATPERITGQVPQVKSDRENEAQEGRRVASRNEPSRRKTESKKPSKK